MRLQGSTRGSASRSSSPPRTSAPSPKPSSIRDPRVVSLPQGQTVTIREVPVRRGGDLRARRPRRLSLERPDVRDPGPGRGGRADRAGDAARPRRRGRTRSSSPRRRSAGSRRSTRWAAPRRSSPSPTGPRRSRRVDVIAGPGNAWVREAKSRVSGHRRDRLAGRALRADGDRRPRRRPRVDRARSLRPGRARRGQPADRRRGRGARPRRDRGARPRAPPRHAPSVADATLALVQVPDTEAAIDLANAYAPEHLELLEEDAALLADRVTTAGCVFAGRYGATAFGDYVGRLQPRPADRRRRPLLGAARARRLPPQDLHGRDSRRGGGEACAARRHDRPGRGLPRPRRVRDD